MAFSGTQITRQGLSGITRGILSFTAKEESTGVDVTFSGVLSDVQARTSDTKTIDYSGYFSDATSYSISPAVESGWSFNTSTGILTITDSVVGNYGAYTITGEGTGASADSNTFYVDVIAATVGGRYGKPLSSYEEELRRILALEEKEAKRQKKNIKARATRIRKADTSEKDINRLKLLEQSLLEVEKVLVEIKKKRAKIKKRARILKDDDDVMALLMSKGYL